MQDIQFHPYANVFPLIEGVQFRDLVEDVRQNGLRDPIVLHDGLILDGRNRYRACHAAQASARYQQYSGKDPLAFVISRNLRRRHLDASQRAMIAAELVGFGPGKGGRPPQGAVAPDGIATRKAAKLMDVSKASLTHARRIVRSGTPALSEAVKKGTIAVTAASEIAKLPPPEQAAVLKSSDLTHKAHDLRERRLQTLRTERAASGESAAAVFKFFKVGHGRALGEVRSGEVDFLIRTTSVELAVLRYVQSLGQGNPDIRLRDLLDEKALAEVIACAKREVDDHAGT